MLPGDDLYCCQPRCAAAEAAGIDYILACKPGSHKKLYEGLKSRQAKGPVQSTGWLRRPGQGKRSERHRFRWTDAVPLRKGREALQGTWIEYAVERGGKRTCTNSFFAHLAVAADNAERIARAGRARWKIENEDFNCLARHGDNFKRNFGHGKAAPANVPAVLNLFAFALHAMLQCVCALWQQCRRKRVTRRALFRQLQIAPSCYCFPDWPTLPAAVRDGRAPPGWQPAPAGAWTPRKFVPAASGERSALAAGYRRSASSRGPSLGRPAAGAAPRPCLPSDAPAGRPQ